MKCAPPFSLQGFPTFLVTYPCTVVPETLIDNVKLNFFFTFLFCGIITRILTAFSIIFLPEFVKKNGHPLFGLSSKVFTFDHLLGHRSDFFTNLTIFFFY